MIDEKVKPLLIHPQLKEGEGRLVLALLTTRAHELRKRDNLTFKAARVMALMEYSRNLDPQVTSKQLLTWIMYDINHHLPPKPKEEHMTSDPQAVQPRGSIVRGAIVQGNEDPFYVDGPEAFRNVLRTELALVEPGQTYVFPCKDENEVEMLKNAMSGIAKGLGWKIVEVLGKRPVRQSIIIKGLKAYIHRYA